MAILPYQLLLVPSAREACGINLDNSVVIIDEAHNLAGAIESSYSSELNIDTLTNAYKENGCTDILKIVQYMSLKVLDTVCSFSRIVFSISRIYKAES